MMPEPTIRKAKLSEFKPDPHNANLHTERGYSVVKESMQQRGYARPAFAAKDGTVLGGNLSTMEVASEVFGEDASVLVVETDGTLPIIHVRTDIEEGNSFEGQRLALEDNRSAEVSLKWSKEMLAALDSEHEGITEGLWFPDELATLSNGEAGEQEEEAGAEQYSRKIEAPVYEPSGEKPPLSALYDDSRTRSLVSAIDASGLDEELKAFLRIAAQRHTVLAFNKIADYYAHAPADVQALMEDSALVIIDFDKAIELGYVQLTEHIAELVSADYG